MILRVVLTAMAMPAVTFVMMLVAVAVGIRCELKIPFRESLCGSIGWTAYPCTEHDSGIGEGHLGTHANSTTDKHICMDGIEESSQGAVAISVGVYNLLTYYLPILDIIELELLRVPEMLEDFPVLVSDCDSHC